MNVPRKRVIQSTVVAVSVVIRENANTKANMLDFSEIKRKRSGA